MTITVSAAFDSGAIRLVGIDGDIVSLEIPNDHLSDFYQWFHFRVAGARGRTLTFRIVNCAGSAYPLGWPDYRTRVSTDREEWRMAPDTSYRDGVLSWTHSFDTELAWFAYFEPYTLARHDALIAEAALADGVTHRELGQTLDGRAIDCLTLGTGPKQVWLYARQHPGEPMAEWWMEGAVEMLTAADNATATLLREKATIHLVPNMNPDGSFRGHLRTNAAGINLNREWDTPSREKSPEVLCVRDAMDETGVDFAMDVHGDEAIPANFLAGFEGIPKWTDALGAKFYEYGRRLAARTPDFQTERGYGKAAPGTANLSMSTNQLAERFGAVAMTLEMPFKDHDPNPDALHGWDGARSKALAVSCLDTLAEMIDEI
ncbi:MAG: M14-type cytosolic carboxypeptidase [Pseudomonadota bacterium]